MPSLCFIIFIVTNKISFSALIYLISPLLCMALQCHTNPLFVSSLLIGHFISQYLGGSSSPPKRAHKIQAPKRIQSLILVAHTIVVSTRIIVKNDDVISFVHLPHTAEVQSAAFFLPLLILAVVPVPTSPV